MSGARNLVNSPRQLCPFSSPRPVWFSYGQRYIQQITNTYYQSQTVFWHEDDCFLKPVLFRVCNFLKTMHCYCRNDYSSQWHGVIQYSADTAAASGGVHNWNCEVTSQVVWLCPISLPTSPNFLFSILVCFANQPDLKGITVFQSWQFIEGDFTSFLLFSQLPSCWEMIRTGVVTSCWRNISRGSTLSSRLSWLGLHPVGGREKRE